MSMLSCSKDSLTSEKVDEFTDYEINKLGVLHNAYLSKVFKQFNYEKDDRFEELSISFENLINSEGLNHNFKYYFQQLGNCNVECVKTFLGKEHTYIEQLDIYVLSNSEYLQKDLLAQVEVIKSEAKAKIKDSKKLNVVLSYLEVYQYSSYFWLPVSRGGSGEGYEIIEKLRASSSEIEKRCNYRNVIRDDAFAVSSGLISSAFWAGIVGGPIAPAVFFGQIAVGAAIGSAWTAICP